MGAINLGIDLGRLRLRVLLTSEPDDCEPDGCEPGAHVSAQAELASGDAPPFGFAPISAPWDDEE